MMNIEYPDFYACVPHGVGTQSFTYYLNYAGLLTTTQPNVTLEHSVYPIVKSCTIWRRGLSLDRVILECPGIYSKEVDFVISLIRDPVDTLTSFINYFIGDNIIGYGRNIEVLDRPNLYRFITNYVTCTVAFTSIRKCVSPKARTFWVDTKELNERDLPSFFENIFGFLGIPGDSPPNILNTPYNSFLHRVWGFQKRRIITKGLIPEIAGLTVIPSNLYDFMFNQWERSHIIKIIEFDGISYTVSCPESSWYTIPQKTKKFGASLEKIMTNIIELLLEFNLSAKKMYDARCLTWEDTKALILKNQRFYSRFMKTMDREIALPLREVPEKVALWKHFHEL